MLYDDSETETDWLTAQVPVCYYAGQPYMTIMHVLHLRVSVIHLRVSAFQVHGMCLSLYCVYHNSDCYYVLLSGIRNSDMYLNSDMN